MIRHLNWCCRPRFQTLIFETVSVARPILRPAHWPLIALALGLLPLMLGYASGSVFHQSLTGLLLVPLFLACVCEDRLGKALSLVALVLGSHSGLAIFLSIHDPAGAAAVLAGSQAYWEQARGWIQTGDDPDYRLAGWLPQHVLLLGMVLLGAGLTLGVLPFAIGVEQIDLMNFYVGRMVAQSDNPTLTLLLGWHPWSLLRGLGYTVAIFVVTSSVIESLTGQNIAQGSSRRRLVFASLLILADGLAKLFLSSFVREQLFAAVWLSAQ